MVALLAEGPVGPSDGGRGDPCRRGERGEREANGGLTVPQPLIGFLEGLVVTQGPLAGQTFEVLPWERRFLRGALAPGVFEAGLSIGRGNGKSTLVGALGTAAVSGPLAQPRGEVVIVASSFQQAKIAFAHTLAFIAPFREADPARYRVRDSANSAWIRDNLTGCELFAISSDPRRAHGRAPHLVIPDEPAQWPGASSNAMLAALRTALGKQAGSRLIAIGTRPSDSSHWFARMLDGGAGYSQVHAAHPGDPPFRKRTWLKANPSLPVMPELERTIRAEAALAKRDSGALASFLALRLNLGTDDVERARLIDADVWERIEGDAERAGVAVWGVDLGTTAAQSAIASYWPLTGALDALAAFPRTPGLERRELLDGVRDERLYRRELERGELIIAGERSADIAAILSEAHDRFGSPVAIAADRWREGELRDALERAGIPPARLEVRGMGYKDGGEDVRLFRRAVAEDKVRPVRSLLLRAAMASAVCQVDPAGNAKVSKERARARDDAAVAAVLAVGTGARLVAAGGAPTPIRWAVA